MPKFDTGDRVWVPSRLIRSTGRSDFALTEVKVTGVDQPSAGRRDVRSVRIDRQDPNGRDIHVSSKLLHPRSLGVLVLRIGDLATETGTLDPLAKSVLQFMRLLLPDDALKLYSIRTVSELQETWSLVEGSTSHVVLIGHGSETSIRFVDRPEPVPGGNLAEALAATAMTRPKIFVSLSCQTGHREFSAPFSSSKVCSDLLAPLQSVHAASASLYAQALFSNHLLLGKGIVAAHRAAKRAVVSDVSFRHWRDGRQADRKTSASASPVADAVPTAPSS